MPYKVELDIEVDPFLSSKRSKHENKWRETESFPQRFLSFGYLMDKIYPFQCLPNQKKCNMKFETNIFKLEVGESKMIEKSATIQPAVKNSIF